MEEKGYEYVDIYSFGIPVEIYEQGGFIRCGENSENIIPNYFHPFVQENISLKLVDSKIEGVRLFGEMEIRTDRADGIVLDFVYII